MRSQGMLGAGGMGGSAGPRPPDRAVAVKVLPEGFARDADRLARFEREAKAVAALSHPNILAIHDFGDHDGTAYAVMELLEGETLRRRLAGGAFPPRKAVEYAAQVASGLAAAHDRGIVHRDVKPENLFLTNDGVVKILDFGLAAHREEVAGSELPHGDARHGPGHVIGTAGYISLAGGRAEGGRTPDRRWPGPHEMLRGNGPSFERPCPRR
jgi:serine/threonine protein kinase